MDVVLEVRPSFEPGFAIRVRLPDVGRETGELRYESAPRGPSDGGGPHRRTLTASEAARIIQMIEEANMPLAPPLAAGLDGTTVTLSIERGMNAASYTWWNEVPAQWEAAGALARALAGLAGVRRGG